jgi:putative ABC transport system ATP-binding protein
VTRALNDRGEGMAGTAVRVEGLCHSFGSGEGINQVLHDLHLELETGEIVVLTGPSGSGKTTLLTLIGALRSVQQGRATVLGRELSSLPSRDRIRLRREIGFIFQHHNLFDSLSAVRNVMLGVEQRPAPRGEALRLARQSLAQLGLADREDYKPQALSGGQRQRVAIARAVISRPQLILADEPTAALDEASGRQVVDLFRALTQEVGSTVLLVTHDNRILDAADRIVNMVDGRIASNVVVPRSVEICDFLRKIDLFAHESPVSLSEIAEKMVLATHADGDVILRQGQSPDYFYVIRSGMVDVVETLDSTERVVNRLAKGDYFGEIALLEHGARTASVVATSPVETYTLARDDFDRAVAASPSFEEQLRDVLFARR